MKHLRMDYDGIQDANGKIPADEPVFVIRAKDVSAPRVVAYWARINRRLGADPVMCDAVEAWSESLARWQQQHPEQVKVPDVDAALIRDPHLL